MNVRVWRRFYSRRREGFKKPLVTAEEAIQAVTAGSTILAGGFGLCGIPEKLFQALSAHPNVSDLTVVSNDAGVDDFGLGLLINGGKVRRLISSYIGENRTCQRKYLRGELNVELTPQVCPSLLFPSALVRLTGCLGNVGGEIASRWRWHTSFLYENGRGHWNRGWELDY